MPYPNLSSGLVAKTHMYIHKNKDNNRRELLKIQSVKNHHLINGFPIENFYELHGYDEDHPCNHDSFVDCEKLFLVNNLLIPDHLKTVKPVEKSLFNKITSQVIEPKSIMMDINEILTVNQACSMLENS